VNGAVVSVVLGLLLMTGSAFGQGSFPFTITITGAEMIGGQPSPVTGTGSLRLFGSRLEFDIVVPVTVLPGETHFHGPRVDAEMPQFSLPPYERRSGGGITYRGSHTFDPKYVPDIKAGNWYINLHSADYVGGLLSGYILPVPEPRATGIFLAGLFLLRYFRAGAAKIGDEPFWGHAREKARREVPP
jgi:hypothetical protein